VLISVETAPQTGAALIGVASSIRCHEQSEIALWA
jgi:hypothetical protein